MAKQSAYIKIHTKTTTRRKKGSTAPTTTVKQKTTSLPKASGKMSVKTVTRSRTTTNVVKPGDKVIKRVKKKK